MHAIFAGEWEYPLMYMCTVNVARLFVSFIDYGPQHTHSLSLSLSRTIGPLSSAAYCTSKPAQKHFSLLPGSIPIPLSPQQIQIKSR